MSGFIFGGPKGSYFELCICLGSNPATPIFIFSVDFCIIVV